MKTDQHKKHRLVLCLIVLGVIAGAGVVSVPFVMIAVQSARETARREQAENNLRQIKLALEAYQTQHPATSPFLLSLENVPVGDLPEGWTATKTGEGPGSVWKVVEDATAPNGKKALAQTSDKGPNRQFNLCVAEKSSFRDVDLTVAFKAVAGKLDQGGGPVWRYKDAKNYYIARMNPLEDNYRVYKVVDGKRIQLGSADVKAPAGQWHTLRVVQEADRILCYLNGKLHLDVKDDAFKDAGKIGLWTKADAQTYFAALSVKGN